MKTQCAATLTTFLNGLCTAGVGGRYGVIDLYTIYLQNGMTLRWAAWPVPITFPSTGIYGTGSVGGNTRVSGQTFVAAKPYVDRSRLVQAVKLEVSQIKMAIRANPTMMVGSTPILAAIASGMFAGATVYVDRLWCQTVNPMDFSLGTLNWFTGQVAEVEECGRSKATLSVKDPTALLSDQYPRNLYLTGCRHTLGDAGCTFNKVSVQQSGVVQAGSTTVSIHTNLTQQNAPPAPTSAPALGATGHLTGISIAANTYYAVMTYTNASGESAPGPETWIAISGSNQVGSNGTTDMFAKVTAPTSVPAGVTGWNLYVGYGSGQWQLQASFLGFSQSWTQTGPLAQGTPPPVMSTGYFAQGIITFTSGPNAGLQQMVTAYDNSGVVTTAPPLPSVPVAGDTFTIVPDCQKTIAACKAYSNIANYAGCPFVPLPEQAV